MIHRLISLGLVLHILRLSYYLIKDYSNTTIGKFGILLLASGILQTIIGASIPISEFSIWSRTLHLGLATIVWMISFSIIIIIRNAKPKDYNKAQ